MVDTAGWDELTRSEQRLLIKLFAGGTARNDPPVVVEGLRARAFVDENNKLSMLGLLVFTLAIGKQQSDARSRMAAL
jgi:hypothetical protein